MRNLTQLRLAAREIFDEVLRVVDAGEAVRQAVQVEKLRLVVCDDSIDIGNRKIYSIAIGKAASPMALALEKQLGDRLTEGLVVGPLAAPGQNPSLPIAKLSTRWRAHAGGHPLPNNSSLIAAKDALAMLDRANSERALLIFLISGGGSAMLELPISEDVSLEDLRAANLVLTGCGAPISEINTVRRAFSAIKGGRLAARAPDCDQITLIISDVPEGEERNLASGPTLAPSRDDQHAHDIVSKYDLATKLPAAILRAIESSPETSTSKPNSLKRHFVLLDNSHALNAAASAAKRRGFSTEIASDISEQPIETGCALLIQRLKALLKSEGGPACLISGGEFSCPVQGNGIGGRNLETALRLASLSGPSDFVALCAGTDGIDGNSPAAGAIIDSTTISRARGIGLDAVDSIERSDAYLFFVALGDVVATGVTGTNVRDIRILLLSH